MNILNCGDEKQNDDIIAINYLKYKSQASENKQQNVFIYYDENNYDIKKD